MMSSPEESVPGSDATGSSAPSWRPVRILQIDVESLLIADETQLQSGDRLWIEATKRGQVVGVIDTVADDQGVPTSVLARLAGSFNDVELSFSVPVAEERLAKASVIVPTLCRNPPELVRTVASLLNLKYPDFEIIVVDNRTQENPPPLPAFPGEGRVRVCVQTRRGVSAARNLGIATATGDFLAFTDDDAEVDANWLRAIGSRFAIDPEVEGIGGLVLPMELETAPQLWFEEFYGGFSPSFSPEKLSIELLKDVDPMFPYNGGRFGAGCNMAFRKSTINRIGGFDVAIGGGTLARGGEDLGIAITLVSSGGTFAYEPAALVRHTHRRTEEQFFSQVFNYGVGLTAMFTSLVVHDPRHLWAMVRRVPIGIRYLFRSPEGRSPSVAPSYPKKTLRYQILGMAYGPFAYARSALRTRWPK